MEPANISDVVRRLKRRGLAATGRDPADGRLMRVSLTPAGTALIRKLLPIQLACTAQTLSPLKAQELMQLAELAHL